MKVNWSIAKNMVQEKCGIKTEIFMKEPGLATREKVTEHIFTRTVINMLGIGQAANLMASEPNPGVTEISTKEISKMESSKALAPCFTPTGTNMKVNGRTGYRMVTGLRFIRIKMYTKGRSKAAGGGVQVLTNTITEMFTRATGLGTKKWAKEFTAVKTVILTMGNFVRTRFLGSEFTIT